METRTNGTVANIAEFRAKYGQEGLTFRLLVEEFIRRAPQFEGDGQLAGAIGRAVADLESALRAEDQEGKIDNLGVVRETRVVHVTLRRATCKCGCVLEFTNRDIRTSDMGDGDVVHYVECRKDQDGCGERVYVSKRIQ